MKIVYVSRGGLTHTFTYINFFLNQGHSIFLYALSPVGEKVLKEYESKIQIVSPLTKDIPNDNILKKLIFLKPYISLPKYLKKIKPDVVHLHYLTSGGLSSFFFTHPNIFITIHGSDILLRKSWYWRIIQRSILKRINNINVVSKEIEQKVSRLGNFKNKTIFLPVGVDTNLFVKNELDNIDYNSLKIISTRRLESIYNYQTIIHALLILKEKGILFQMTIVGYGSKEKELIKLSNDLGLSKLVSFVGKKSREEISKLLKENCIYVSASYSDGTSLSLLEAMSSGLFPIVSEISSNKYWIEAGKGLMFNPNSALDLASKLILFWNNKESFMKDIEKNSELVYLKGDLTQNMKKLEALYLQNI